MDGLDQILLDIISLSILNVFNSQSEKKSQQC